MNRKVLITILLVLLGVSGFGYWHFSKTTAIPTTLTLYGNVDIRQVQLAFNGTERIDRMLVQEGSQVQKGQLLATLNKTRLQQNFNLRQAQVAEAQQSLLKLQTGSRPEEIRKAQADALAARIDADNSQRTYQRQLELAKQDFIAKQDVDNARSTANAAQAKFNSLQATLRLATIGPRQEDITTAQATLQASEAAWAIARKDLADAALYAPSNGVIQNRILEVGDMASPQRPVYTLALTNPLWIRAYIAGPELGKVKPGMHVMINTDSYPDKHYQGWIGYISPSAEFTPKSVETTEVRSDLVYQVRIFTCDTQNELRLGMPATVTIPLNQSPPPAYRNDTATCDKH